MRRSVCLICTGQTCSSVCMNKVLSCTLALSLFALRIMARSGARVESAVFVHEKLYIQPFLVECVHDLFD